MCPKYCIEPVPSNFSHVQLLVTLWTVSHQAPLSIGILQVRTVECVAMPLSRGSSQPRDQTQVFHIAGDSLPSEPPGKPKNTGVGNLSLLQGSFPTQESNQGLLHCRQILYYWVTRESWWVCTKEIQLKVESLILKSVGLYENLHPEHLPSWVGRVAARL